MKMYVVALVHAHENKGVFGYIGNSIVDGYDAQIIKNKLIEANDFRSKEFACRAADWYNKLMKFVPMEVSISEEEGFIINRL